MFPFERDPPPFAFPEYWKTITSPPLRVVNPTWYKRFDALIRCVAARYPSSDRYDLDENCERRGVSLKRKRCAFPETWRLLRRAKMRIIIMEYRIDQSYATNLMRKLYPLSIHFEIRENKRPLKLFKYSNSIILYWIDVSLKLYRLMETMINWRSEVL